MENKEAKIQQCGWKPSFRILFIMINIALSSYESFLNKIDK